MDLSGILQEVGKLIVIVKKLGFCNTLSRQVFIPGQGVAKGSKPSPL